MGKRKEVRREGVKLKSFELNPIIRLEVLVKKQFSNFDLRLC